MQEYILEGQVNSIIFYNEDNGYTVFSFSMGKEEFICVGFCGELTDGEHLRIWGHFTVHEVYGKQLKLSKFERVVPTSLHGMERYLSSGIIKGVGVKTAKRIVECFQSDTFKIIENDYKQLTQIKGISLNKAEKIHEAFSKQSQMRNITMFLQNLSIGPVMASKIYKRFQQDTIQAIEKNPYHLIEEIEGIGFKTADMIAKSIGFQKDSPDRIKNGLLHILDLAKRKGHCYLPKQLWLEEGKLLLELDDFEEDFVIKELIFEEKIVIKEKSDETIVYLQYFFESEQAAAKKLIMLGKQRRKWKEAEIRKKIKEIETEEQITLAKMQVKAVIGSFLHPVSIISGGPGTGKTTVIKTIVNMMKAYQINYVLAAPTGRAAKRMSEASGSDAKTIHRLLEIAYQEHKEYPTLFRNNEEPLDVDAVIVDESSMIDIILLNSLLKALKPNTVLIFVGDKNQLPSVGPGNVLHDLIDCGLFETTILNKVYRQKKGSTIAMNAHKINEGQEPVWNEKNTDCFFIERKTVEAIQRDLVLLLLERIPKQYGFSNLTDIQVLTPMKKGKLGTEELNQVIQHHLNPPSKDKKEMQFRRFRLREGDRVMQIKNNYQMMWEIDHDGTIERGEGIFNGDEGFIQSIHNNHVDVLFHDGKKLRYSQEQLDELDLSYAITIHKSQGSEYPVVILPLFSGPSMLLSRNLLYTAVSRAKEILIVIGQKKILHLMLHNMKENKRYTNLSETLTDMHGIFSS